MTPAFSYALLGLGIGLMTSAPVGPVNIMALRRAIHFGFSAGILVGLGAVVADTLFAAAALFGISAVAEFVELHEFWIKVTGAALLVVFAIAVLRSHPHVDRDREGFDHTLLRDSAAAFAMTITNPGAVLGFLAILEVWATGRLSRETISAQRPCWPACRAAPSCGGVSLPGE
ncbi:LysE family translocator [Pannonibacter phragmitetus]|uniref:LysE family translocator n=1 Tax=Pannonibacter phragmitetus TaxID=121719 RepID=UPI003D2EFE11